MLTLYQYINITFHVVSLQLSQHHQNVYTLEMQNLVGSLKRETELIFR